jgi:hypothetical protein
MTKLEALSAAQEAAKNQILQSERPEAGITFHREADGCLTVRVAGSQFGWKINMRPDRFELISQGEPVKGPYYFPWKD